MIHGRPKLGIQVAKHERKLFAYLYQNRVATSEQIHRDIYPHYSKRSAQNRLAKLTESAFIKRNVYQGLGNALVYSLADKGFTLFVKPLGFKAKREFGSHAVAHDLDLLEIRRILRQRSSLKRYLPEILISGDDSLVPDGVLLGNVQPDALVEVELRGKPFCLALEYESACKFANRYKELFQKYYAAKTIPGVLYICKNESLLAHIRNIEKGEIGEETPKFYYSDFSKWSENGVGSFTNLRGSCITL